jgi:hypothetical protein
MLFMKKRNVKEDKKAVPASPMMDYSIKSVKRIPRIEDIPQEDHTPLVVTLIEIIQLQQEQIQALKDEIAQLKGQKPRPKIRPSKLEKGLGRQESKGMDGKRPGSLKRSKTSELVIDKILVIKPEEIPAGSRFKGYQDYTVQDIVFKAYNTRYRLERWQGPDGENILGKLPDGVVGNHYGAGLLSYVLYQYYQGHVTQPLILEQLLELGVDISAGEVNRIITEGKDCFHEEKDEILRVGLEISGYINVDDTGARHKGKNGYCTHIGNELFAWFESTDSKSRINFLKLLCGDKNEYVINPYALDYMSAQRLPRYQLERLRGCGKSVFENELKWKAALESMGLRTDLHIRIATEGALLGSIVENGLINPGLVIVSDEAGQFAVLLHALCWIHAERGINKLVGYTDAQRKALEEIRAQIWDFYGDLKAYKEEPCKEKKTEIEARFDEIFGTSTCYQSLNLALDRIRNNKSELLLVLDRPEIPLHNNTSERDIREYVKKRKISGSTRSDLGRRCRDTFISLKKTCRKLNVSFWHYIRDRVSGGNIIEPLADLIRQQARQSPG